MTPATTRTAAIITGCVVPKDAVSNICLQQADALGRPSAVGAEKFRVRLFAHGVAVPDTRTAPIHSAADLLAHPDFLAADLIVFHFAIQYPAFDALHLAPRSARVLAYYHGVTPPSALPADRRPLIAESFRQAHHLTAADAVLVTSDHLKLELLRYGVRPDRIVKVPPAVAVTPPPRSPRSDGGPLRLLYVGRFVPAKGVLDLVEAFKAVSAARPDVSLDLAGATVYSDPDYLADVRAAASGAKGAVRFHLDLPSDKLADLYASADVFALPSRHEGFGVPIIEALTAGCYVVCTAAGASAETAGGLGQVVPVGNVAALTAALNRTAVAWEAGERLTADGPIPAADWHDRAARYTATFTRPAFEERFRAACLSDCPAVPAGIRSYFAEAQRRSLARPATAVRPESEPLGRKLREAVAAETVRRAA